MEGHIAGSAGSGLWWERLDGHPPWPQAVQWSFLWCPSTLFSEIISILCVCLHLLVVKSVHNWIHYWKLCTNRSFILEVCFNFFRIICDSFNSHSFIFASYLEPFFPPPLCTCTLGSCVCDLPWSIFCSLDFVFMNDFSWCLLWNSISPSFVEDHCAVFREFCHQWFCCRVWNSSTHTQLALEGFCWWLYYCAFISGMTFLCSFWYSYFVPCLVY